MNIALIGAGRFGINYLRSLNNISSINLSWVCSRKQSSIELALSKVKLKNQIKKTTDFSDILNDQLVDAVIIATPASTHFEICKKALLSDKHVLVEKPITLSLKEAEELTDISSKKKLILMVGHLHLFNPGIQKLKEDLDKGLFGNIKYIQTFQSGDGLIREDMSALWDFFPHIVSILLYLFNEVPVKIHAQGHSFIQTGIEDVVNMNLNFSNNIFSTSFASWIYPTKKMEIVIVCEKGYAVFNDCLSKDKLKYYFNDPANNFGGIKDTNHNYIVQEFADTRPLSNQISYFIRCVTDGQIHINGKEDILKVTKILESAHNSILEHNINKH